MPIFIVALRSRSTAVVFKIRRPVEEKFQCPIFEKKFTKPSKSHRNSCFVCKIGTNFNFSCTGNIFVLGLFCDRWDASGFGNDYCKPNEQMGDWACNFALNPIDYEGDPLFINEGHRASGDALKKKLTNI